MIDVVHVDDVIVIIDDDVVVIDVDDVVVMYNDVIVGAVNHYADVDVVGTI